MFGKSSKRYIAYRNAEKYYQNISGKVDIISLGSTMAYYDYDYQYWDKLGINLASSPQTLSYDYSLLRQFGYAIKKDTIVFINIAEFTFLVSRYENDVNNHKYYFYLNKEYVENYKEYKNFLLKHIPCLIDATLLKNEVSQILHKLIKRNDKSFIEKCCEIKIGWDREFKIHNKALTYAYDEEQKDNLDIVKNMVLYIKEKGAVPVLVVPPVAPSLFKIIPQNILADCLYKNLDKLSEMVEIIDLSCREDIFPDNVFETPLILNMHGKKIFNEEIKKMVDV